MAEMAVASVPLTREPFPIIEIQQHRGVSLDRRSLHGRCLDGRSFHRRSLDRCSLNRCCLDRRCLDRRSLNGAQLRNRVIRIGTMGFVGPEDILADLHYLECTLRDLGRAPATGAGVQAAAAVLAR